MKRKEDWQGRKKHDVEQGREYCRMRKQVSKRNEEEQGRKKHEDEPRRK
jgi:hypothetical protein